MCPDQRFDPYPERALLPRMTPTAPWQELRVLYLTPERIAKSKLVTGLAMPKTWYTKVWMRGASRVIGVRGMECC